MSSLNFGLVFTLFMVSSDEHMLLFLVQLNVLFSIKFMLLSFYFFFFFYAFVF